MTKSLSLRQVCFMLIAYNAVLKLMLYPSAAAQTCGNALIFSALINFALQTVIVWSVAYLSSKTDKTFFALLEDRLGRTAARIMYALLGLYFLFAAVVPMNEQQLLVHDAFYDTVPSLYIFLPVFFFTVYAGAKDLSNAGRCADICLPLFVACIAFLFATSVGEADYSNLLPVLKQPAAKVLGGALAGAFRFSESAFLLIFMGHYKCGKGDTAKLTLSYAAGGIIVIILMGIYYSLYGALTPSRSFILNNISVFFPVIESVGRLDLIVVYVLDIAALFAIVLHVQAFVHCMTRAFGYNNRALFSLVANAALIAVTFIVNNKFSALHEVAARWFFIPALVFAYALPLAAWALRRRV